MRINFRQGIVSHQSSGAVQTFLSFNGSGNIDLIATNRSTIVSIAHKAYNYLFNEDNTVTDAWGGPFNTATKYWLYWDINPLTAERTFGSTTIEPVAQAVEPGSGDSAIVNVITGDPGVGAFAIHGQYILPTNKPFSVINSTGNDGAYTVHSTSYNTSTGETTIIVNETVSDLTIDGDATLDFDSQGIPLKTNGRHWYDTITNTHYILNGTVWSEVLRVFAAVVYAYNFTPYTINQSSYIGTQIGDESSVKAGRILSDDTARPIIRDDRTFFTTESEFFADSTRVDGLRLESNVVRAQLDGPAVAKFSPVAWKANGKIQSAQYDDIGSTVVGILTEDLTSDEVGAVIVQGSISNVDWDLTTTYPVGSEMWIENGNLVLVDPHVSDPATYPYGRVPVARVLDRDTIIFEQGLGGKGDRGPQGTAGDINPATTTELGGVLLSYPPSTPELPIVVTDNDPRFSAPPPAHTHMATSVITNPANGISSLNAQDALEELSIEVQDKLSLSGGVLTDYLTLHAIPDIPLHAATKGYVDSLVAGLIWIDPICIVNMISDTVITPPLTPATGDSYIIPAGATGSWSAIPINNVVSWDTVTTAWIDRGPLTGFNPDGTRAGIALNSPTTASGSFTGHENEIALYDELGVLTGFEVPVANNAVFVCSESDMFAYNQFAFSGTEWILFGGGAAITPDGVTTVQVGNILSVKQWPDGGEVDAMLWQGLEPADLASTYAPISHTHNASDMTITAYTGPNWGTPGDIGITNIVSTDIQSAIEELQDEKAPKLPFYPTLSNLPPANTVHGMIAYVDSQSRLYFSSDGSWIPVATSVDTPNIPYDMAFFVAGVLQIDDIVGSFAITRNVNIVGGAANSVAICSTPASDGPYSLDIVHKAAPSYTPVIVGTITFNVGVDVGVISVPSTVILNSGDLLQLVTDIPTIPDPSLQDLSITIVGCAATTIC